MERPKQIEQRYPCQGKTATPSRSQETHTENDHNNKSIAMEQRGSTWKRAAIVVCKSGIPPGQRGELAAGSRLWDEATKDTSLQGGEQTSNRNYLVADFDAS